MQKEVQANRLPDVTLSMKPLHLTPNQLAALETAAECHGRRGPKLLPDSRLGRRSASEGGDHRGAGIRTPDRRCRLTHLRAFPDGQQRSQRRPERKAGTLLRQGRKHDPHPRRRRPSRESSRERRRAQHDRRPGSRRDGIGGSVLDACAAHETGRRPGLQQPRVPSPRHEQGGRRPHRHGRARVPDREHGVHRILRPAADPRAGHLPLPGLLRAARLDHERVHAACAAGGARPDREHDDGADRRAATRDRRDESDRRHPSPDPRRLPAHRAPARRRRLGDRRRARCPGRERGRPLLRELLRDLAGIRDLGSGGGRERPRRSARAAACGATGDPPRLEDPGEGGARRGAGPAGWAGGGRPAAPALAVPAPDGPDRHPQRHASRTAHGHDRCADRPCRRDAARRARAHRHGHQDHQPGLEPVPLRRRARTRLSAPSSTRAPPG